MWELSELNIVKLATSISLKMVKQLRIVIVMKKTAAINIIYNYSFFTIISSLNTLIGRKIRDPDIMERQMNCREQDARETFISRTFSLI